MIRSLLALSLVSLLSLCVLAPRAAAGDDDDDKPSIGKSLWGAALKGATGKLNQKLPAKMQVSDHAVEATTKTVKAFRKSAEEITEKEEYFIGRSVAANILARYPPVKNEGLNRYLQSVAQAVAMASDRPDISKGYHVQVVEADEINALSTPGGFIFVTTGLLKNLKSEDELAAVLGHEIAHIAKKHGLKTIKASRLTKAFEILGTEAAKSYSGDNLAKLTDLFGGSIDDVVNTVVVNGYSRDKEYEADANGALYAQRANYDPKALPRFIKTLGSAGKGGGFLKTHPSPKSRLSELAQHDLEPSADYQDAPARATRFSAAMGNL